MGSSLAHARTWRTAAFCSLGLAAAMAAGVIVLALRPAAVPFVIEANETGEARLVGPATSAYEPSDAQLSWHLARFIEMVRGLPSDPIVVRQNWLRAYDWATQGGAQVAQRHGGGGRSVRQGRQADGCGRGALGRARQPDQLPAALARVAPTPPAR